MRMIVVRTSVATVLACALCAAPARAQASVDVVHAFSGLPGASTSRLLQASNGLVYGTLREAGPMAAGAVVAFVSSGGGVVPVPLHVFERTDGRGPTAGLIEASDGAFYGTTMAGGAADRGTVFKVTAQGQFTLLHSFAGLDGAAPFAGLIQAQDGRLYGTTTKGGTEDRGTIFNVTPAGDFTTVHSFTGPEGANPFGGLLQATDGNFYGTAAGGGHGAGTVFRLTAAGAVDALYFFDDVQLSGMWPTAALIQGQDGALYGTAAGLLADHPAASVFRITTSGDFTALVRFFYTDLGPPLSGVIQGQDGALYGTAVAGTAGYGAIFRVGLDGTLTILHVFNSADGAQPYGGVMQASDGNLYGLTRQGGAVGRGTAYRITTGGVFTSLYSFIGHGGDAPSGGVIRASDGNLYGTTASGGLSNSGTVFRLSPDGQRTTLHEFTGADGGDPNSGLFQARSGLLYGVTDRGGAHNHGTIFAMTTAGAFQTLHSFTAAESFGALGTSPLIQGRDGMLYGIAGGSSDAQPPLAFRMTPGGALTLLATIPHAAGPLVEGADGNFYGTAGPESFSSNVQGSIFRMTPAGAVTTLAEFVCDMPSNSCPNGAVPAGGLVATSDGALYGVTTLGFASIRPTVFRFDQNGLAAVTAYPGFRLSSRLIRAADGRFYGTGSVNTTSATTVYSVSADGDLATLHVFSGAEDASLSGPLLETEPGVFYGTASPGGPSTHGMVYRLTVPPGP